ncbi:MAG TPA: ribosome-binding factor A [Polyangiaceae bacterium]|jgi:ribosome-binding factor A|nr:ribosome-binding factor A [Polyangiaceae bacterium]
MGNRTTRRRGAKGSDNGVRALRLEELFRAELNSIFDGELGDERLQGVLVTFVELAPDGSRARVWYSMNDLRDFARAEHTHFALLRAAPYLRGRLSEALPLKRTPELSFRHDPAQLALPTDPLSQQCPPRT